MMTCEINMEAFFNIEDVEKAIKESNFNKAIGPDGFDGKILTKSEEILKTVSEKITEWLKSGKIPQYIKEGRLILLSKTSGEHYPEVNNTRAIIVNSHLNKIVEKVIVNKLQEKGSELMRKGNQQSGFKQKKMALTQT
ncbi:Ubiquitin carboxyl-terminal hydrolase [Oxytricha trifallax]|uniref:Ubiquitin carboxyl-terminal hydrolase n=1 Tax=Oxytricha trifallax TaxID=1172189 RepID=A0A073IBX5_9SPIT|nr:Ubiquitin carboxyl-terminal hydrolase [Oxytricha trifallax]